MVRLGAAADPRLLHLDEVADVHFVLELRAGAQARERPDDAALADDGVVQDAAREDLGVRADHAVAQHDVRADAHAVAELDLAFEDHVDVDVHVASDLDRAAHVEARGIGERHALRHQLLRAPAAVDGFDFGQLQLVVHAQHLVFAVGDDRRDRHPVLDGLHDHVGQVVLALRVVVLERPSQPRSSAAGAAIRPVLISWIARSFVVASFCSTMRTTRPPRSRTMRP